MTGELVYFMIGGEDAERSQAFYGRLLGWEFDPGSVPEGFQIRNAGTQGGLFAAAPQMNPQVYFHVDDIEAAVAQVREMGGEAQDPQEIASGWTSYCQDDQGCEFNLWAPRDEEMARQAGVGDEG